MKHKKFFDSKFFRFLKYFFSLVIVPFICFVLVGIVGTVLISRDKAIKGWFKGERDVWGDIVNFYVLENKYRLYGLVLILVVSFICLVVLNYKDWLKNISRSQANDNSPFLYNQESGEGNLRKFKKEFANNNESGFVIGHIKKYGDMVNHSDSHMILLGIAGSGKTWRILFQNIVRNASLSDDKKANMVIIDPKQELLEATGGILKKQGYDVKLFDLDNPNNSVRWNPLKLAWDYFHSKEYKELSNLDYSEGFDALREVVEELKWGDRQDDGIWVAQAKNVVMTILKFMVLYSLENKKFSLNYFTLSNVVAFLNLDTFTMGEWTKIVNENRYKSIYWEKLKREMDALITTVPETLTGILINATKALIQFSNDLKTEEITSKNNVDFEQMIGNDRPFAIFISFPDHKKSSSFLIPILISQIYKSAISKANSLPGKKLNRSLLFIMEEFNSIEKIPNLGDWMSISRSRKIFFLLVLQDYTQLDKYNSGKSEHKLIKSQARLTVFLETNNEETLKAYAEMLGKYEKERKSTSYNGKTKSVSSSLNKEFVMDVGDLKYKSKELAIVLAGGYKPIAIKPMFLFDYMNKPNYEHREIVADTNDAILWDFEKMTEINIDGGGTVEKIYDEDLNKLIEQRKNLNILCSNANSE
ncbi:type IV secretory system conjugative DNA transfer family protein [Mycoplasma sp. CSL7475-4]|uniref:type IV secretory system conjugative DNA transfer family protein n=2 Tax=unclassified Mycoplasma TaxID=2683645 RepID=UPI00216B0C3E|nr:type IV secretory system conjugative DNA transfer family protein [Mycoplasma sp. CSL7475-4]MCS4537160.1 type IV secretory system conjugative DNA transfer family protein [Mycoplasma sp. CSL7475-4]